MFSSMQSMTKTLLNILSFNSLPNGTETFRLFTIFNCHARFNQSVTQSLLTSMVMRKNHLTFCRYIICLDIDQIINNKLWINQIMP